jgi:transposase-like protein
MEQRADFVGLARQPDANISELCLRFLISRKTGYKWLARDDLQERSRRPHKQPQPYGASAGTASAGHPRSPPGLGRTQNCPRAAARSGH